MTSNNEPQKLRISLPFEAERRLRQQLAAASGAIAPKALETNIDVELDRQIEIFRSCLARARSLCSSAEAGELLAIELFKGVGDRQS